VLHRRYSQFDELKNCLVKSHPATKALTFPPKVLLGNLQPKVIEERTNVLGTWINELLSHADEAVKTAEDLLAFLEATSAVVKEGDDAPKFVGVDIHGRPLDTSACKDELVIFAAASRYNFQKLTEFVKPAQADVLKQFPNMRAKIVSVADLRVVPSALRSKVEPVLRKVEGKDAMILVDSFMTGEGTDSAHLSMESYFIPDYTGDILRAVSCADANWTFRLFICLNGKVISCFQSSQTKLHEKYVAAVSAILKENPLVVAPVPAAGAAELKVIKEGPEEVGARKSFNVEFEMPAAGDIVFTFDVPGGSTDFELVRCAPAGGGEEIKIMPKRSYSKGCKKRAPVGPGVYSLTWKPAGMLRKSTLNYSVARVVSA